MFPITMSTFFLLAARTEVAISGREVPIAIIERPKKDSEILSIFEIFIAELTVICAPNKVNIIERKIIGTPYFNGFVKDRVENISLSSSILFISLEEESLKLLMI